MATASQTGCSACGPQRHATPPPSPPSSQRQHHQRAVGIPCRQRVEPPLELAQRGPFNRQREPPPHGAADGTVGHREGWAADEFAGREVRIQHLQHGKTLQPRSLYRAQVALRFGGAHDGAEQRNQGRPQGGIGPVHPAVGVGAGLGVFSERGLLFGKSGLCVEAGVARALPSIPQGERRWGTRTNGVGDEGERRGLTANGSGNAALTAGLSANRREGMSE